MRLFLASVLTAILLATTSCTTDEPGPKKCEVGTSDPDLQCVGGYFCDCKPDGCFCVPNSSAQPLHQGSPQLLREKDPNLLFLRRMGLIETQQ